MKRFLVFLMIFVAASCSKTEESPYMKLAQQKFDVSADGETVSLELSANVRYSVINDMEWAELKEVSSQGGTTVYSLTLSANSATEQRVGTVRFIGERVTPLKVTVTQREFVPTGIDVTALNVTFDATSVVLNVYGEKNWTVSVDNSAFVPSVTSGSGNGSISLTFPENTTFSPVVANVTVTMGGVDYVCVVTQGAAPSPDNPVDLSAQGTANCYIVSQRGYYKFQAGVRGNGVEVTSTPEIDADITPARASVLWATFNTGTAPESANAIIKDVTLRDGYVVFGTEMTRLVYGNAIIAVYDNNGAILWTWHIWVRPAEKTVSCGDTQWLDYNLGALSDVISETSVNNFLAVGFYYQWGRKDPLLSITGEVYGGSHSEIAVAGTQFPAKETVSDKSTVGYSIANPQSHFLTEDKNHNLCDWVWLPNGNLEDHKNDLWGGTGAAKTSKTMYDPCPVGYSVPSATQVDALKSANFAKRPASVFYVGDEAFKFVFTGGLSGRNNLGYLYFDATHYFTSDVSGSSGKTFKFTTSISYAGTIQRSFAFPIRCVKE